MAITLDGTTGTTTPNVVLPGSASGTITLAAPSAAGTQSYTLPTGLPGTSGYALTSTTGGVMSWAAAGGSAATPTALGTVYGVTPSSTAAVALGYQAANTTTSATSVTAIGYQTLLANTGSSSTAVGYQTLLANTSGARHTAIGQQALQTNTTGNYCVAAGYQALGLSNGDQNTAVGYVSGSSLSTGGSNCFFGSQAGASLTTGTNNTILGYNSNASAVGGIFQICIGSGIVGQGDSYVTLGSNTAKVYNQFSTNATWTQTSDARLKTNVNDDSLGLSFINRLRPVTFTWKASNEIDPSLPYYNETNQRNTTTVIHGLIAQEVKAALDAEGCSTFNGWDAGNEDTIQAISREMFISPLIKAIQELTARVAALEAK